MERSSIRIVVAEDFSPFREFICATLRKDPDLQIHEVSDGPEAVRQAEVLKPHLILLDISLPGMNGIEVAQIIRNIAPESKLIFVTQESDAEIVQDVLDRGAWGYVSKMHAGRDLLRAVEAVSRGTKFVSIELTPPQLCQICLRR